MGRICEGFILEKLDVQADILICVFLKGDSDMIMVELPQHNEAQITRRLQPRYSSKHKLSDPSDTLPRDNVRLKEVRLYQGGKWVREDDALYDENVSALDCFDD